MARNKKHLLLVGAVALGMFAAMATSPASADPSVSVGGSAHPGYNAIPAHVSENVPSVGPEAYSFTDIGDLVTLGGDGRTLQSMSVAFSSWGCQDGGWTTKNCVTTPGATFDVPLTYKVYANNAGSEGALLATGQQNVAFRYRPSSSPLCTTLNPATNLQEPNGKWYNKSDKTCYNGSVQVVKMDMPAGVTLPNQVIWAVSFNTTNRGPSPLGVQACYTETGGCGYDSLNVGVWSFPNAPFSGTDVDADALIWSGATQTDWTGYRPLGAITTIK